MSRIRLFGLAHTAAAFTAVSTSSIASLACSTEGFETLCDLLSLTEVGEILEGDGPFTVFAPTDSAFGKLDGTVFTALVSDTGMWRSGMTRVDID